MYGTGTFIITNFNFLTTSSPKNINRQKSVVFYITMLHTVFISIHITYGYTYFSCKTNS